MSLHDMHLLLVFLLMTFPFIKLDVNIMHLKSNAFNHPDLSLNCSFDKTYLAVHDIRLMYQLQHLTLYAKKSKHLFNFIPMKYYH